MKTILKIEEAALLGLAVYLNSLLPYSWWWYWALFLAPDLGMLGYLISPAIGAFTYNLVHHRALAIGFYFTGLIAMQPIFQLIGLILLGHISFDRILGYGLKYPDGFTHTHLGWIGKDAAKSSND